MEKSQKTRSSIPHNLNYSLEDFKKGWKKYRKMREASTEGFKPLHEWMYYAIRVRREYSQAFIADLLGVTEPRIKTILDSLEKKGGENI